MYTMPCKITTSCYTRNRRNFKQVYPTTVPSFLCATRDSTTGFGDTSMGTGSRLDDDTDASRIPERLLDDVPRVYSVASRGTNGTSRTLSS